MKPLHITGEKLQRKIMRARPWTPTALILRISNLFPEIRPAFLELVSVIEDVPSPGAHLFESIRKNGKVLPWFLVSALWMLEHFVPLMITDAVLRFVIINLMFPFFLVKDELSYIKMEKKFEEEGADVILDIVGEEAKTPRDAEVYLNSYLYDMRRFGGKISVKPSSLVPSLVFFANTYEENKLLLKEKLRVLFTEGKHSDAEITVDAEEYFKWCHLTEDAFLEVIMEPEFRDMENEVGIVLQTYRKDVFASLERIVSVAKQRKYPLRVRVVKGAYWGAEHSIAFDLEEKFPLFERKEDTDWSFNATVSLLLKYKDHIRVSVASHNAKTIAHAISECHGDYSLVEYEVLVGMGESIRRVLCKMKIPVSVYCPRIRKNGCIKEGMAYLIRRLDEVATSSCVLKNI